MHGETVKLTKVILTECAATRILYPVIFSRILLIFEMNERIYALSTAGAG
jgi:hypothetical protein